MATLHTRILGVDFENPFLLAYAPPTALIESIYKAVALGWGEAVLKTITPDDLEMNEASPRYGLPILISMMTVASGVGNAFVFVRNPNTKPCNWRTALCR